MAAIENLRLAAMNRHRKQLFGEDAELTIFETSPADGETSLEVVTADWFAHRVWATTAAGVREATSSWQFQVAGDSAESDRMKATVLSVGDRRWKITKVEQPLPGSAVWKFKAQEQK